MKDKAVKLLNYEIIGEGEPLVFMHGLGAHSKQSADLLAPLAEELGLQLILPDLRGHGDSELLPEHGPCNFDRFAADVLELLDELNLSEVHMGGMSMGSGVSLNIALANPERVKSLILLRPSWIDQTQPKHLELVAKVGEWIEQLGTESVEAQLEQDADYLALKKEQPNVAKSLLPLTSRSQAVAGARVLYEMYNSRPFESLASLAQVKQPALVLDTTEDNLHPQSIAQAIGKELPNVTSFETLPPRYLEGAAYTEAFQVAVRSFF